MRTGFVRKKKITASKENTKRYIETLSDDSYSAIQGNNLIVIDPNMSDLLC